MQKRFIVLDGIDGSGKSRQARMLADWLRKKGKKVFFTHEPTRNTKLGRYIEKRIRQGKDNKKELLRLYTEDRKEHLKNQILPALKKGETVICDRYYYSTLVYQLPESIWKSYARQFLKPDIAFICDVPAKIAMQRIEKSIKGNERRYRKKAIWEKEKILSRLRKKYLKLRKFNEVRIINSIPSREEIFEKIKGEVEK